MPETVRLLRQEHANMAMLLDLLDHQLARFRAGEEPDYAVVKGIIDYFLSYPDLYHHPKEDLIYLRLKARDREQAATLADLLSGHDELALLTRRFARATLDRMLNPGEEPWQWFTSLGREFVDTNRRHMAKEEEYFFPLVLRLLTAEDWAAIDAQVTDQADPLFGGKVERRFAALHDSLLAQEREELGGPGN